MINKNPLKIAVILSVLLFFVANIFSQVDVPRSTKAITYPLDEDVNVIFRGTTRFPRMKGDAKIKRSGKNGTEIKLSVSKMPRPFELGAGYATYVLWAISPNGQIDNLGEIKRRGFFEFDSTISVTTPLQTFALIVTAEPHFLVTRPSQEIMLENLRPYAKSGRTIATSTAVQYFGNSSDYFRDSRTPEIADVNYRKTPISILQAQQAIALAKYAGAEQDAPDELQEAQTYLNNADNGWQAGREEEYVDIAARKAISSAVQAETTANVRKEAREKRNVKLRQDADLRDAEDKYVDAQREISNLKEALAGETRSLQLSERDKENFVNQIRDLKAENARLRQEAEDARIQVVQIQTKQRALEEAQARTRKQEQLEANSGVLMKSLTRFGTVDKTERGIELILDEDYWSGIRVSSFSEAKDPKLSGLAEVLANSPDYNLAIESHTDNSGTPAELELLTDERARAIADKMMSLGVPASRLEVKGFGATVPIVPNSTRANRAKNRRVKIVLVPNI